MKRILLVILLISFVHLSRAQTSLQPYHWAWSYLDYLKTAGYLPSLNMNDRPWPKEAIVAALDAIDPKSLSAEDAQLVILLKKTLLAQTKHFVLADDSSATIEPGIFTIWAFNKNDIDTGGRFEYALHPSVRARFGKHIGLYVNYKIFNQAPPHYIGKKFRNLYAYEEQGYLSFRSRYLNLKIGRDFLQTGPGRSGQLLFSAHSRPFDLYDVRIGSPKIYFKFYGIQLDKRRVPDSDSTYGGQIANRFINGHGLYVNLKNKYYFGISEIALYGGPDVRWQLALMNPLNIYYGTTANGPFMTANSFYDLNFDLYLPYDLNVYGDVLIDDFQVDKKEPGDLEPNEIGLLIGGKWNRPFRLPLSRLNFEYVQIRNRTYNAPMFDWEKFVHRNAVIGYYLGNDLKAWYGSFEKWWGAKLYTQFFVQRILKGEGSVLGEFNKDYLNYTVEEGYDEAFPWGVVEKRLIEGVQFSYHFLEDGMTTLKIEYNTINNFRHKTNKKRSGFTISLDTWIGL